jgi:DNA gyrase/topoisomerase IV subunit A
MMRAKMHIEDGNDTKKKNAKKNISAPGKPQIVITELPYQTNKVK